MLLHGKIDMPWPNLEKHIHKGQTKRCWSAFVLPNQTQNPLLHTTSLLRTKLRRFSLTYLRRNSFLLTNMPNEATSSSSSSVWSDCDPGPFKETIKLNESDLAELQKLSAHLRSTKTRSVDPLGQLPLSAEEDIQIEELIHALELTSGIEVNGWQVFRPGSTRGRRGTLSVEQESWLLPVGPAPGGRSGELCIVDGHDIRGQAVLLESGRYELGGQVDMLRLFYNPC